MPQPAQKPQTSHIEGNVLVVSVVLPVHGRAYCVGDAINSVLAQQCAQAIEVVVVNDDPADVALSQLLESYKSLRDIAIKTTQGVGVAAARNQGVQESRGDIVMFLDSDDVWLPHHVQTHLHQFANDSQLDAVVTDARCFVGTHLQSDSWFRSKSLDCRIHSPYYRCDAGEWLYGSIYPTPAASLRRSAFDRLARPYFPVATSEEDWAFFLALMAVCTIRVLPVCTVLVRRFDDGAHDQFFDQEARTLSSKEMNDRLALLRRVSTDPWYPAAMRSLAAERVSQVTAPSFVQDWNDSRFWEIH